MLFLKNKKSLLFIVVILLVGYYFICTVPLMVNNIVISAERNVYSAINYGIKNLLSNNEVLYDNIVNINYDSTGNISTIKTNMKVGYYRKELWNRGKSLRKPPSGK